MFRLGLRPLAAACVTASSLWGAQSAQLASALSTDARAGAAVVVGVSHRPGLGFAVAKRFAAGGMKVGIVGRQPDRLDECRRDILAAVPGAEVECVECDATDPAQVKTAFGKLRAAHGAPSALVYNLSARPFPPTTIADCDPARLEADWRTGAFGAMLCVQEVIGDMRANGEGTVLFTGASASLRGSKRFGSFAVSKTGLRALAQSLAKEVAPDGVHVAHVVVDAMVDMPVIKQFMPDAPSGRLLDTDAAAEAYWQLHMQTGRCFTFEIDVRPLEAEW